ncbi:unnamed protein product [Amoebophrya sp. A120]|nr:unnamed protein product [Amoebophrya sp. A120]|eukprot:GSA120T00006144001.1
MGGVESFCVCGGREEKLHTLERKEIAHAIAAAEEMKNSRRDFAFAKHNTTKSRNLPLLEEDDEADEDDENHLGRSVSMSSKRKSRRILSPAEADEDSDGLGLTSPKGNVSFLQWYVAGQELSTGRDRYSVRGRAGTGDNHNADNAAVIASRHHKARLLSGPSLYDQYTGDVDPLASPLATDGARREISPIILPEAKNRSSTSRDHKAAVGGVGALGFDNLPISEKRSDSDGKWKLFDVASHSQSSTKSSAHIVTAPAPPGASPRSATPSIGIMTLKNSNYDRHDTPVYPYTNSSLDRDLPRKENQSLLVSRPLLLASFETSANKIADISTTAHFRSNTNHADFSPQHDSSPIRNRKNYISY